MAKRTAGALNALVHGVCLDDFESCDQDALQDVLFEYFTDPKDSDDGDSCSEPDLGFQDNIEQTDTRYLPSCVIYTGMYMICSLLLFQ